MSVETEKINRKAEKDEKDILDGEAAIEELKRIKREENPPFWVQRGKDFNPELDVSKISPETAVDILRRYKELAKKREPEKKNRPSSSE